MPSQAITVTDAPLVKPGDDVNVCIAICKAVPVASKRRIKNSDTIVTLFECKCPSATIDSQQAERMARGVICFKPVSGRFIMTL